MNNVKFCRKKNGNASICNCVLDLTLDLYCTLRNAFIFNYSIHLFHLIALQKCKTTKRSLLKGCKNTVSASYSTVVYYGRSGKVYNKNYHSYYLNTLLKLR